MNELSDYQSIILDEVIKDNFVGALDDTKNGTKGVDYYYGVLLFRPHRQFLDVPYWYGLKRLKKRTVESMIKNGYLIECDWTKCDREFNTYLCVMRYYKVNREKYPTRKSTIEIDNELEKDIKLLHEITKRNTM